MGAALFGVAALLGLLALALAVPVEVAFRFAGLEPLGGHVRIRWLFGLLRFDVRIPDDSLPPGEPKPAAEAAPARAEPRKRAGRANVLAVIRQAAFRRRVYRLVADLLAALRLRQLRLRMRLGLGDPADTGRLWALAGPLGAAAHGLRGAEVRIEPEFEDAVLEVQAQGRLLVIPLQLLWLALAFVLSPAAVRAWVSLRRRHA